MGQHKSEDGSKLKNHETKQYEIIYQKNGQPPSPKCLLKLTRLKLNHNSHTGDRATAQRLEAATHGPQYSPGVEQHPSVSKHHHSLDWSRVSHHPTHLAWFLTSRKKSVCLTFWLRCIHASIGGEKNRGETCYIRRRSPLPNQKAIQFYNKPPTVNNPVVILTQPPSIRDPHLFASPWLCYKRKPLVSKQIRWSIFMRPIYKPQPSVSNPAELTSATYKRRVTGDKVGEGINLCAKCWGCHSSMYAYRVNEI